MIDKGADVLYAERFGVSDAAKERGKLAIGNVIDTQDSTPTPWSRRRCGTWSRRSTAPSSSRRKASSSPRTTVPIRLMKHQGASLAPLGTFAKKVPADFVAKVKAKQKAHPVGRLHRQGRRLQPKASSN